MIRIYEGTATPPTRLLIIMSPSEILWVTFDSDGTHQLAEKLEKDKK